MTRPGKIYILSGRVGEGDGSTGVISEARQIMLKPCLAAKVSALLSLAFLHLPAAKTAHGPMPSSLPRREQHCALKAASALP